jgi:hypothetical protein
LTVCASRSVASATLAFSGALNTRRLFLLMTYPFCEAFAPVCHLMQLSRKPGPSHLTPLPNFVKEKVCVSKSTFGECSVSEELARCSARAVLNPPSPHSTVLGTQHRRLPQCPCRHTRPKLSPP